MNDRLFYDLKQYYNMLYPEKLKQDEYIRLLKIRKDAEKPVIITEYVKNFAEYFEFVEKNKYSFDLYNQLATNSGTADGTEESQFRRKVLYLDFDRKDYPDLKTAQDVTQMIKSVLPKLFLHAYINSGNGFHVYICLKNDIEHEKIVDLNVRLAKMVGADLRAVLPTQIARIPCTFNHKQENKQYDYEKIDKWKHVTVINNSFNGTNFRPYSLSYLERILKEPVQKEIDANVKARIPWQYQDEEEYPCHLCTQIALKEGVEQGQRNFWHGRIVHLLSMQGYTEPKIYAMCQEWNLLCRPPKSAAEIEQDTKRYMNDKYQLLGCYESISDEKKREMVEEKCDKAHCATYHTGAKISFEKGEAVRITKNIITNKDIRSTNGNLYLIITILYIFGDSYGRRGFKLKNLREKLYSKVTKKHAICDPTLKKYINMLVEKNWVKITADTTSKNYWNSKIQLSRKIKETQMGYIEHYFAACAALINGIIDQQDYLLYIVMIRNLGEGKAVTYQQLADDTQIDIRHIGKHIRNLELAFLLMISKEYTNKGREYNKYDFVTPDHFTDAEKEVKIRLLA